MERSERKNFFLVIITTLLFLLGYLTYQIIRPFFASIGWGIIFSIIFYPFYIFALKFVKFRALASLATLCLIILLILGPLSYMGYMLVGEVNDISAELARGGYNIGNITSHPGLSWLRHAMSSIPFLKDLNIEQIVSRNLDSLRASVLGAIGVGAKNTIELIMNFVFMSFAVFFLLKDGPGFAEGLKRRLPFSRQQNARLERQVRDMVASTIFGGIIVAIIEGCIGGVAFWILSFKSPVFFGLSMFITSFLPVVGSAVIWVPAAIYLFMTGAALKAAIMLAMGIFLIGGVDNFLRPLLIGGRTKMHMLLIFFSVLGGVAYFGLIGLILGPLTVALFLSVVEIFGSAEGGTDAEPGRD
jgi:predicted PurR-regulated permease PerM